MIYIINNYYLNCILSIETVKATTTCHSQQVAVLECSLSYHQCRIVANLFLYRFYIDKFTFLKETTTVELFFLNAKSLVYKVSMQRR